MAVRATGNIKEAIAFSLKEGKGAIYLVLFALSFLFMLTFFPLPSNSQPAAGDCGDLARPLPGSPETSDYGPRTSPCSGCSSFHRGIDIRAQTPTPFTAPGGGTCQTQGGYGTTYTTPPNNAGYRQFYAHLSSCNTNGSLVTGSTGVGTAPHLHYGVIAPNGQFVDPHSCAHDGQQPTPSPPGPPSPPSPPSPGGGGGGGGGVVIGGGGGGGGCDNCCCEPVNHGPVFPPPPGYTAQNYGSNHIIRGVLRQEHQITTDHILEEFEDQEEFLINPDNPLDPTRVWGGYLLPAWMMMTEQLVHTAMYQMLIVGTLLDAKQQLETQMVFQKLMAEAHQDYQPSVEMCVFGTNVRSLAEAERNYEYTTFLMSQRSIDRQMGNMGAAAARGQFDDHCFRLKQFRQHYCDQRDNNDRLRLVCDPQATVTVGDGQTTGGTTVSIFNPECVPDQIEVTDETKDKDISFSRTVDRANTLELDFYTAATEPSRDEEDIFALASNLYSHDIMYRMPETAMRNRSSQDELLDMRTIVAKRSVAEHSFNTIIGMKAQSKEEATELTYPYMRIILEQLGLDDQPIPGSNPPRNELEIYLGERPSYYAQMGVLTKRLYQSPDFFANLYDEPVNVERKGVALQAIGLMQDFDTWQSYLRTEAMLSVIMELELLRLNNQVENLMGTMRSGGIPL